MLKSFKYRLYPNKEQEIQIQKTFGCCRFVYNQTLAHRKELYETEKKSMSKIDCNNFVNQNLKKEYEWRQELDNMCNEFYSYIFDEDSYSGSIINPYIKLAEYAPVLWN